MNAGMVFSVSVFTRDLERVFGFYRDLLGLPEYTKKFSAIFRALESGDALIGFHAPAAYELLGIADRMPAAAPSTSVYVTFLMPHEQAVGRGAARALELGGSIIKPPFRTYYHAWQTVPADPEGNMFRLSAGAL